MPSFFSYTNVIKVFFVCYLLSAVLFHAILIKIFMTFFAEWEQIILNCICKHQTLCIAKAILKRKRTEREESCPLISDWTTKLRESKQLGTNTKTATQINGTKYISQKYAHTPIELNYGKKARIHNGERWSLQ